MVDVVDRSGFDVISVVSVLLDLGLIVALPLILIGQMDVGWDLLSARVHFLISGFMVHGDAVRMVIFVMVEFDNGFSYSVVVVDLRCWCRDSE
jgi:hypothetical protein